MTVDILAPSVVRREIDTMPPIECPNTMIFVPGAYLERINTIAASVYDRSDSSVGPWNAERSSLKSTAKKSKGRRPRDVKYGFIYEGDE